MSRLLLILTIVLVGCVHMTKDVLVDRSDQPVPQEDVRFVADSDAVPDSCELVAYLYGAASEDFSSEQKVVDKFKKQAGKLGANLVTVQEAYGSSGPSSSVLDSGGDTEFDGEAYWCGEGSGV